MLLTPGNLTSLALYVIAIFCGTVLVTGLVLRHLRIIDIPNARSSHSTPTPRGGGLGIVAGFFLSLLLITLHFQGAPELTAPLYTLPYLSFLAALLLIGGISLFDDITAHGFASKLLVQLLAILLIMANGIVISPLPTLIAWPITLLWVLGLTNAYNFMDGLDGMAGSTAAIVAGFFALICAQHHLPLPALLSLAISTAACGFLCFNWPPARIFMGDIGSTFLGFAFATLAVLAAQAQPLMMAVMPLLLLHFLFDTIYTFTRRLLTGERVTQAHRSHFYQLLNRSGYRHRTVSLIYASLATAQGLAALWLVQSPAQSAQSAQFERLWIFIPFLLIYSLLAQHLTRQSRQQGLL
ncbi:MAG: glycosyltransferase family 4 protein [Sterolibacterium sp.]|nr:glycosyltransferase family 4 protein [Sterolibacterium sp.]